jgi:hypothetical protein
MLVPTRQSHDPRPKPPPPPPRSPRPLRPTTPPTTTLVRASSKTTILVRASDPVPTLPSCVPRNPRHTTASPGPPSLAARPWRSFDGEVGRERNSKAIASPRAQLHESCGVPTKVVAPSPSTPTPPEAAPPDLQAAQQSDPSDTVEAFRKDANCAKRLPKEQPPTRQLLPKQLQGCRSGEPNRAPALLRPSVTPDLWR